MTDKRLTSVPDVGLGSPESPSQDLPVNTADPANQPIEHAVRGGKYLDVLKAQQLEISKLLDEGAGTQTAQLHRTLTSLTKEIKESEDLIGVTQRQRTPDEKFKGA